ncbi:MAG: hypothetical protein ABJL57_11685 [Hyphomonas sp.]|uniref:hypothetical protein n=1 Tax=Hyphomonas sp. TaxID=87 RepID=UPI003264A8EF
MTRILSALILMLAFPLFAGAQTSQGVCLNDTKISTASITSVGEALVTVAHWAELPACAGQQSYTASSREYDIAVLKAAEPGECRNVEPGEGLVYEGFPGDGGQEAELEQDTGELVSTGFEFELEPGRLVKGLDVGTSSTVRAGYSGGAVRSKADGRLVGIIVGQNGNYTAFTPIETVCAIIRTG